MLKKYFFFSVALATTVFFSAEKASATAPNLYEGFDYAVGTTTLNVDAANWNNGWAVYGGAIPGTAEFGPATISPLTVSNLVQTGNYFNGNGDWAKTTLREFNRDWDCPYAEYKVNGNGELALGAAGKTIWISVILRPQLNQNTAYLGGSVNGDNESLFRIGAFGGSFWGLKIGATEYLSTVPIVDNELAFLVCKIEFGAVSGATVSLYVNPAPGTAPTGTPITQTTTDDLSFRYLQLGTVADGTAGSMAADELRLATTYALVAPSAGGTTGISKNLVENARVYSQNGKIIADLSSVKGASTVSVIDTKGSVIKTVQTIGSELVNINVANKGVYLVRVQNGAKVSTVKVVL